MLTFWGGILFVIFGIPIAIMEYGYIGVTVAMPPILVIMMGVGVITGFFCAMKNAVKAIKTVYGKEGR